MFVANIVVNTLADNVVEAGQLPELRGACERLAVLAAERPSQVVPPPTSSW